MAARAHPTVVQRRSRFVSRLRGVVNVIEEHSARGEDSSRIRVPAPTNESLRTVLVYMSGNIQPQNQTVFQ